MSSEGTTRINTIKEKPLSYEAVVKKLEEIKKLKTPPSTSITVWRWLSTAIFMSLVLLAFWVFGPKPIYDPLDPYPQQVVELPRMELFLPAENGVAVSITVPTLRVTRDNWPVIPIAAIKCANQETDVRGAFGYRLVYPPSQFIEDPKGKIDENKPTTHRAQGCSPARHYKNEFPEEAKQLILRHFDNGIKITEWRVEGYEKPLNPKTKEYGVENPWSSEEFAVICDCEK